MQSCFMAGAPAQEQEQWLYGFSTSTSSSFEHIQMPHEQQQLQDVELEAFHEFNDLLDYYKPFQLFDDQSAVKEEHFEHYNYDHGSNKMEEAWQLGSQVPVEGKLNWKPRKSGPFQSWSNRPRALKTPGHKGQYMLKTISEIYRGVHRELKSSQELLVSATCQPQATKEVASSHNHKIAERTRRKREGQHLETLRSCLPSIKKKDKVSVLQGSIDYIKQLMCQVRDLERQNKVLEARVMLSEEGPPMVSTRSDEEVNKSSDSHQSFSQTGTPGSMVTQEDGLIPIQLGLETTGRQQQLHMLISMLTCIKEMGFEVYSLQWNPENSSKVDLTLQSKMKGASTTSAHQVQTALERRMFGDHAIT